MVAFVLASSRCQLFEMAKHAASAPREAMLSVALDPLHSSAQLLGDRIPIRLVFGV